MCARMSYDPHPKLGSYKKWNAKCRRGGVGLSPSMAAWPGSVIEDDLVRKSEGQRMQAAVPARHGMAAASQLASHANLATPLSPRASRPRSHPCQVTLSQEGVAAGCPPRVATLSVQGPIIPFFISLFFLFCCCCFFQNKQR